MHGYSEEIRELRKVRDGGKIFDVRKRIRVPENCMVFRYKRLILHILYAINAIHNF